MKHNFKYFACLLVAVLCFGQVWAVDYELVYTLDGSVTSSASGSSAYATAIDINVNNITWNVMGNTTLNPWGIGGKNLSSTDRVLFSKGAVSGNILKIDIEHGAAFSVTVNSMKVEVATDADFKSIVSTCNPTFAANSTVTVNHPDEDAAWEDCYYRITYKLTIGSSNKKVEFKSAKFYKEASGSSVAVTSVSLDESSITLEEETTQTLTATVLPNDANQNVTWESSDESVATVVDGLVTAIAAGDATITCKSAADATKSATCAVHVTASPYSKSKLIFTEKCNGSGTADDDAVWTVTSDATESTFDNAKGIHYGTSSAAVSYVQLSTDDIQGTVKKVVVNASGASNTSAVISVKVGTTDFTVSGNYTTSPITASAADFTFTGSASGEIMVFISQTSTKKAIYCKSIVVTYESNGKQEAGLAYAKADQKKLAKVGEVFTAPTLTNPNNLTVSYASSNSDVAEVASNGAVTIKAAGVAVITASFEENEYYNAGSASYTIGVTSHAGTQADPYVAADAKIAIDVKETIENAYATGIVSNVVTTSLPSEGYISFYFSADGLTSGQQIEAYKCFGLNSAQFEAVSDVVTGATVVVTGNLKKYNSTYEFDQNCHLVSYEAPAAQKQSIANDQAHPYTVAQAITFAADAVTYDLDDYVYVQGVVYDVKSFSNGAMNIFIKDANAENQFELYKCAGINDGNSTTPFEALTDVQAGNIVIGYGQLTVYNTTYEFKQGNFLVDLQKTVTGVELDATASVEVDKTVNLTATIQPSNATGTIVWTVENGSDKASVANGVVTGLAEGQAVIRASVQGTEIYAECTVTVTAASAPISYDYALVTDAAQLQDGLKVIIVASETDVAAGSAAATYRNVVDVERTTNGDYLILDSENMPTEFTLGVPAAGQYTFHDGDGYMYEEKAKSVKNQTDPFNWSIRIGEGNIATIQATNELRYNSGSPRFTTYASGQQALQLFVKSDGKQAAGLAWSTNAVELTVGDVFTAPTLTNPNNLTVTIASNNTELATVEGGVVSLVENATGTATITASYAGDDTYRAASVSYTITVNSAEPPTYDYALVTDAAQLQDGLKVIIVASETDKAAGSAASTYRNVVDVERTSDGNYLILDSENMPTEFTLGVPSAGQYTLRDGDGYMYEFAAKSVKVQADPASWSITIGEGNIATIQATNELRYNSSSPRFTTYASGQQALQLFVKSDGKQAAGLAWSTDAIELTVDDEFTAPTLTNPNNLTVTIASNNTELATVENGVVSLVENTTGTATITASYTGDDTYRATSVSYTITVSEAVVPPTPMPDAEAKVIVVTYNNKFYAMSTTIKNGTGFEPIEVEKEGGKIIVKSEAEKAAIQWQMAVGESTATFQNGDNKYLACGSNSNTELALLDAVSEWAWDADSNCYKQPGKDDKGRTFYYNYNSGNPIFRAYTVSGIGGEGYSGVPEFVDANNIEVRLQYETIRSGLEIGRHYTACLKKKIVAVKGATIWGLRYRNDAGTIAYLEQAQLPLAAGTPFIYQATDAIFEASYEGADAEQPIESGALRGTFDGLSSSQLETLNESNIVYLMYNNSLRPLGTNNHLDAFRAYLLVNEMTVPSETPQDTPGRHVRSMSMQGNVATGIEDTESAAQAVKVMIDGKLFILRGEKLYDVTGQMVK